MLVVLFDWLVIKAIICSRLAAILSLCYLTMDGEDDYSDHEYYNIFLGIPKSVHEALRCLQERQAAIRNTSNGESTNFTNSSEAHRQKTIESVLKLFTGNFNFH